MLRILTACSLAASMVIGVASMSTAQEAAKPKPRAAASKVGPGQKVCNYKFKDGEKRSWVCDKDQPCCVWDEIRYVKCGSTITKCL